MRVVLGFEVIEAETIIGAAARNNYITVDDNEA